jgi:hypothetical protein
MKKFGTHCNLTNHLGKATLAYLAPVVGCQSGSVISLGLKMSKFSATFSTC